MAIKRPRIFQLAGFWLCVGEGIGLGASPLGAYADWYAKRFVSVAQLDGVDIDAVHRCHPRDVATA